MAALTAPAETLTLRDLPKLLRRADGWNELIAALLAKQAGTIDGAWGSAAALAAATLALDAPTTLLIVLPHVGDLEVRREELLAFHGGDAAVLPAWETWPIDTTRVLDDVPGKRLRLIQRLASATPPQFVLTTLPALMQPVPDRAELSARGRRLRVGESLDLDEWSHWLVGSGFKRVDAVELRGEFSRRGGILDIFSVDAEHPIRVELFGDEIESLRRFSAESQRGLDPVREAMIVGKRSIGNEPGKPELERGHLTDWLPSDSWIVLEEPLDLQEQGKFFLERVASMVGLFGLSATFKQLYRFPTINVSSMPAVSMERTCRLRVESIERFSGSIARVREELDEISEEDRVLLACHNEAESKRLREVFAECRVTAAGRLAYTIGRVQHGFRLVDAGLVVIGSHELFHREAAMTGEIGNKTAAPRRGIESRAIDSFLDLKEGDYVVHVAHGIAIFRGMALLTRSAGPEPGSEVAAVGEADAREEHLILEFREGARIYVPVAKIDLVQKYIGGSKATPTLSKLGGTIWTRKKAKVEEAVRDLAAEMIRMQALRTAQPGFAYPVDTEWQADFEASFPYQETPDQLAAINDIKNDMQQPRPMDRLLCGDVGFGKTEVAIRAAFKAIDNGKQVAVLVPTTILAEQHYRTFSARLAEYPFTVEMLSRFRSPSDMKKVMKAIAEGGVDIVIGTHKLLSKEVRFKDLGLVIIDEEQRFGVEHKEKLKQMRALVDVLTMSATPIPRTLNQALLGIREISNLETPPLDRLPIETRIIRWDNQLIRHAILRELNREGQVYFVHNRVMDIQNIAQRVQAIVPEARVVVAHGQMHEHDLEAAMLAFLRREADILTATTIIESGVDIPNANTIFINQADNYGLANLHQLRGRVGRQKNRAYAYLILSETHEVTAVAAKRLKVIEEFTELGSGFKIAMRDLEIRGAGNILGTEQSGHIEAVGYELYCRLLENAVRTLKREPTKTVLETTIHLPWPNYLPRDYVPGQKLRLEVYRRLSRLRELERLEDFRQELRERFGPIPEPAEWLLHMTELRIRGSYWEIEMIHRDGKDLVLSYRNPHKAEALAKHSRGRLKVVDERACYCRLSPSEEERDVLFLLIRSLLPCKHEVEAT